MHFMKYTLHYFQSLNTLLLAHTNSLTLHNALNNDIKSVFPVTLTNFASGDKLYAFIRGSYGLEGLPSFLTKEMYSVLKLIDQGFAFFVFDAIFLLSHTKINMLGLNDQLHQVGSSITLNLFLKRLFVSL